MGTRRTRRYKMRRPLFAFGQLMLPLVGIVALGLLIVGVKLFFLPGKTSETPIVPSGQHVASEKKPTPVSPAQSLPAKPSLEGKPGTASSIFAQPESMQIAVPVDKKNPPPPSAPSKPREEAPSTPKITSPPPAAPAITGITGSWGVQVGAFTKRDQATALMQTLQKTEKNVLITTGTVNGKTYYRVRVVAGKTRADAERLEKELRRKGYPTLVVDM